MGSSPPRGAAAGNTNNQTYLASSSDNSDANEGRSSFYGWFSPSRSHTLSTHKAQDWEGNGVYSYNNEITRAKFEVLDQMQHCAKILMSKSNSWSPYCSLHLVQGWASEFSRCEGASRFAGSESPVKKRRKASDDRLAEAEAVLRRAGIDVEALQRSNRKKDSKDKKHKKKHKKKRRREDSK